MRSIARRLLLLAPLTVVLAVVGQLALVAPAHAGQLGVTIQIRGAGTVSVVEGDVDGGQPACNRDANTDDRLTVSCPRFRSSAVFAATVWLKPTPAADRGASRWKFAGWIGCDDVRVRNGVPECGLTSGSFSSDERTPTAQFNDTGVPQIGTVTQTLSQSERRSVTYAWSAPDAAWTECSWSAAGAFGECTSPATRVFDRDGEHKVTVRALNRSGRYTSQQLSTWVISTSITEGPRARVASRDARVAFASPTATAFVCSLDDGPRERCASGASGAWSMSGLADGDHVFRVWAGNEHVTDPVPAVWRWNVDATPPETTITEATTGGGRAAFRLAAERATGFECRLFGPDGVRNWAACSANPTYADLVDGDYRFEARSYDELGNLDQTPAVHEFTVDTRLPETTVTGTADRSWVVKGSAAFAATSSIGGSTFACRVDGVTVDCPDGKVRIVDPTPGRHEVSIAAVHGDNVDPTPEVRSFVVPVKARKLTASSGWKTATSTSSYGGKLMSSNRSGSKLTVDVVDATRVGLVASIGRGHGTVGIYAGKALLKKVSLNGSRTVRRVVLGGGTLEEPFTGRIKVVVLGSGRPVQIEGLGVDVRPRT